MKTQVVGHSGKEGVAREARILNRLVRATRDGWEYECDQRHVEIILEQLILLGSHVVRTCSKTQNTIAQSSAESELLAIVRAATEALGMISLAADLGIVLAARIHVDASAALGILERRGVGRVRHLDVGALWLQEQALRRAV